MKLPPNVFFRPDLWLMIFRPQGILNEKKVNTIVAFLEEEEERTRHPFNRFSDLSKLDAIDLEFRYVFRVSLHRRLSYASRPPVKSAFYVPNKATAQVVKVHALVTDLSPLQVELFSEIAKAAEWLGVLPKDLQTRGRVRVKDSSKPSAIS
jgi:hypothetical protein